MSGGCHSTRASGATQIAAPGTEGFPRGCLWAVNDFLYRPVGFVEQKGKTILSDTRNASESRGDHATSSNPEETAVTRKNCGTFLSRLTLRKVRKL